MDATEEREEKDPLDEEREGRGEDLVAVGLDLGKRESVMSSGIGEVGKKRGEEECRTNRNEFQNR